MSKGVKIDLSDHPNPAKFVEDAQSRYPDTNVNLFLEGTSLRVEIADTVHPQIKASIFSFVEDRAREEISFNQIHH